MNVLWFTIVLLVFSSARVEAQANHCDFGRVSKFSKFNKTRLAIMYVDGIVVHDDLRSRYNRSNALVFGNVSCLVTIDKEGKVTAIKLSESSGDKKNDDTAIRLIRAASPFKISPQYEGLLKVHFGNDEDLVRVLAVQKENEPR